MDFWRKLGHQGCTCTTPGGCWSLFSLCFCFWLPSDEQIDLLSSAVLTIGCLTTGSRTMCPPTMNRTSGPSDQIIFFLKFCYGVGERMSNTLTLKASKQKARRATFIRTKRNNLGQGGAQCKEPASQAASILRPHINVGCVMQGVQDSRCT